MAILKQLRVVQTIPLLIMVCFSSLDTQAKYGGGTGDPNDPYLIYTAEQMNTIGAEPNDWDKHFKLMENIDLSGYKGTDFNLIATGQGLNHPSRCFTGVFDGNDHTITNFSYNSTRENYIGLFGMVDRGEILNIGLVNPRVAVNLGSYVGSLVAFNGGTITACYVDGGSILGKQAVGGLVGKNGGTMADCHAIGNSVSGYSENGGLVGYNYRTLTDSSSTATVNGGHWTGGLVGKNTGTLTNSYSTGTVTSTALAGGLVGSNSGLIKCSYAMGTVEGTQAAGFVGENKGRILCCYSTGVVVGGDGFTDHGIVYLCYWDTKASGINESATAKGKTTNQMKRAFTYRGWGNEGKWIINDGNDYPRLMWEQKPGKMLVDPPHVYGGGTGEPNDPFVIRTAQQLASIGYWRKDFGKHFTLANDIDLSTIAADEIEPIGIHSIPFKGTFLGNGNTIMNLTCRTKGKDYVGFFGYIGRDGYVEDLRLTNVSIAGNQYVGGLAGYSSGVIDQCSVTGTVVGNHSVGGLVGFIYKERRIRGHDSICFVARCSTKVQVTGNQLIGGLVGSNTNVSVRACFSNSRVAGRTIVGGLVGLSLMPARRGYGMLGPPLGAIPDTPKIGITSCYSRGRVEGHKHVGGLAGGNGGLIQFSYSASRVIDTGSPPDNRMEIRRMKRKNRDLTTNNHYAWSLGYSEGQKSIGGLVGTNNYGVVLQSYWDTEAGAQSYSASGKGKTTQQMMSAKTFSGWGYRDKWVINKGNDYPRLEWEKLKGKSIKISNRYSGGVGKRDNPYRIQTLDDFIRLSNHPEDWNKCFVLMSDLDFQDVDPNLISPIGVYGMPFTGVFNGHYHTISNFKYLSETESYLGVFGSVRPENPDRKYNPRSHAPNGTGIIINLNLENVAISAFSCAGGLAGFNAGTISNCSVTGNVATILKNAGGLLGYNVGKIIDCSAKGTVKSKEVAGGLIARNGGLVKACYFHGTVEAEEGSSGRFSWCAGGIAGYNCDVIDSCHFKGNIKGLNTLEGLVGINVGAVIDCTASGGHLINSQNVKDRVKPHRLKQ